MEYYKDITKHEKSKNLSEFLILYSSQSNNFGQSWVKAFCGLILFSFISYIPIGFLTSEHLNYGRYATTINDILFNAHVIFVENLKSWIVLLNPTHRIKDISESIDKFSPWVYFWDFLSRVIISYFIFQTVSAFRKFSR